MDNNLEINLNKDLEKEREKNLDKNLDKKESIVTTGAEVDLKKSDRENEIIQNQQEIPFEKLSNAEISKEEKRFISGKDKNDVSKMGMGMDILMLNADYAESASRSAVRTALRTYLDIRKNVLEGKKDADILADERERFGQAYEDLVSSVDSYVAEFGKAVKHGKGQKRLKKMARIKELINMDNRYFMLSGSRREMMKSLDAKNESDTAFPTFLKALHAADSISNRNQIYKDNRKKQEEKNELPGLSQRHKEWWKTAMKNNWDRTKAIYNMTGGLIDRTIGIGTMIASNTLILAGKVAKMPLKLLSMAFNAASKKFGSKKKWTVDYSLTKGWAGLTESRQIFRDCAKGVFALPVGMYDSLVHGFPYLFRKMRGKAKPSEKVYRTSAKLFGGIGARIANIMQGLGFYKSYDDLKEIEESGTIKASKDKESTLLKQFQKSQDEMEDIFADLEKEEKQVKASETKKEIEGRQKELEDIEAYFRDEEEEKVNEKKSDEEKIEEEKKEEGEAEEKKEKDKKEDKKDAEKKNDNEEKANEKKAGEENKGEEKEKGEEKIGEEKKGEAEKATGEDKKEDEKNNEKKDSKEKSGEAEKDSGKKETEKKIDNGWVDIEHKEGGLEEKDYSPEEFNKVLEKKAGKKLRKRASKEGWDDKLFGRFSEKYSGIKFDENEIAVKERRENQKQNDEKYMARSFKHFSFSTDKIKNLKNNPDYEKIMHSDKKIYRNGTEELDTKTEDNRLVTSVGNEVQVKGMLIKRVASSFRTSVGEVRSNEQLLSILKRLDATKNMEDNKLSKEEANRQFTEAFLETKQIYYVHLKRMELTYGKLFSQIHPYDMLRMIGGNFYKVQADFMILQDVIEMTNCKPPYFDMNNEKDKEFSKLANYYNCVYTGVLQQFGLNEMSGKKFTNELKESLATANEKGLKVMGNVTDKDIKGPSLSKEEKKRYIKDVRNRARAEGWDNKLFGRFEDPKVKPVNRDVLSTPNLNVPESLDKAYDALEKKHKNANVNKTEMKKMRSITKSVYEFNKGIKYAIPKEYYESLKKNKYVGQDPQSRLCLMRPVKVNADGNPINKDEERKLNENMRECYSLMSEDLAERKPFLDRVLKDAKEMIFSIDELKDPKFILKNKERAIRHLAFMHNLTSLYDAHAEYYLKDASVKEEDREFLFMLVKGTKYISFSTEKIHQALFGNGVECSYVGENALPGELLGKKGKKVRKVEDLGAGEKAIYKGYFPGANGDVDEEYSEGIIRNLLIPYTDKKTSSSVDRNKVRSGMGTYMETEEIKNVVQYKAKPAEAKNKDKK